MGRLKADLLESPLLAMNRRYVFYDSLLEDPPNKSYQKLGQYAQKQVEHFSSALAMSQPGEGGKQIMQAINFLKNSAEFERQKELNFFKYYETAYPEIKKCFNINIKDIENDYIGFITNINRALKGTETLKKEVNSELKRISENRAAADEIYHTNKKLNKTSNEEEKKVYETELKIDKNIIQSNNSRIFFKQSENQDKSFFNATFFEDDTKRKSVLARLIMENYGAKLFSWHNNKLYLDERQKNALIALLTMKANEMFVTDLTNITMPMIDKSAQVVKSTAFEKIVNKLLSSSDLINILNSMVYQYNMQPGIINSIKDSDKRIKRIEEALKASFDKLSDEEKKGQSYDNWRKEIGLTKDDIKKMITANSTIKVQTYYVGEDLAMLEWLGNNISAILGGGKNPTDDIQAGTLITTIEVNSSGLNQLRDNLWAKQAEHFKRIGATSTYESFQKNTEELRQARQEQEALIKEFMETTDKASKGLNDLISHINIHSTVKGYESAGTYTFEKEGGFGGAAFGASLDSELKIIDSMAQAGGLDSLDIDNLFVAMINCGQLMIGRKLKKTVENYFSAFMGMLMFNDAELFASDVQRWLSDKTDLGSVQDLHMYQLNGLVVPSSYILQETYNVMSQLQTMGPQYRGVQAKFKTYDKNYTPGDWKGTSQAAIENTKLERMHFLADFVGLLSDIQIRLNNIG